MLGMEARSQLDACRSIAVVLDPAGRVVFANRRAVEFFGQERSVLGRTAADLVPEWPVTDPDGTRLVLVAEQGFARTCEVRTSLYLGPDGPMTTVWIEPVGRDSISEQAERDAERRLRYMIEMLPQAICVFDAEDRYVLWNSRYAELYTDIAEHLRPGIAFEEILRLSLASGHMPEIVSDPDAWLAERMTKFRRQVSQEEQQLRDGQWLRYDDRRMPDGGAIGIRIDITELKRREEWLRQLFDANPMPMLLCDGYSLAIRQANRAAVRFYGFAEATLLTKKACDLHIEADRHAFASGIVRPDADRETSIVWRQRLADNRERHVLIYVRMLDKGADRQMLLTIADVTDRVLAEAEAQRLANHDVLTGLPNRMHFYKALGDALAPKAEGRVVVYCLDLDGFKPVNDVFGHAVGDDVLKLVGERLRSAARSNLVARLGGDEFAILSRADGTMDTDLADRCIAAFDEPFVIREMPISLGISIGIAVAAVHGADPEALVQAADGALYQAKAAGRNTWRATCDDVAPAQGRPRGRAA